MMCCNYPCSRICNKYLQTGSISNVMSGVYTIPSLKDILSPIFGKYDIRKAVLFGSCGKGAVSPLRPQKRT